MNRTLPVLLVLAACSSEDRRSPAPTPAQPPALAHATQQDLARELDDADVHGTWTEVKRRWTGQVLRWTVTRQQALCASEHACNVLAFPIQRPAKYGWLPQLVFAPGQYAALESACAGKPSCEISIEGTLARLEVSGELPTNLRLEHVTLRTTTAQR
jgi:hypothetical protein